MHQVIDWMRAPQVFAAVRQPLVNMHGERGDGLGQHFDATVYRRGLQRALWCHHLAGRGDAAGRGASAQRYMVADPVGDARGARGDEAAFGVDAAGISVNQFE